MGRLLVVLSAKGGTGKSLLSAGLACALTALGKRVLLVDTDVMCSLDLLFPMGARAVYDLGDVVSLRCRVDDAVIKTNEGFDLITGPKTFCGASAATATAKLILSLSQDYDFTVIDRPAGCDYSLENSLGVFEGIVPVSGDSFSMRAAAEASRFLTSLGVSGHMVINLFEPASVKKHLAPDIDRMIDETRLPLLGVVVRDEAVTRCKSNGTLPESGAAHNAFSRIARRIAGERVPLPDFNKL